MPKFRYPFLVLKLGSYLNKNFPTLSFATSAKNTLSWAEPPRMAHFTTSFQDFFLFFNLGEAPLQI